MVVERLWLLVINTRGRGVWSQPHELCFCGFAFAANVVLTYVVAPEWFSSVAVRGELPV